ncbi:helix-turn-helix transcriptional regulator [Litoreibacter halocynthiae]|uniref:helix-turn-helix transcriptional regulator n=1 Tax=Litoreibacter halocynthiae TaxID=1242689 RepID=UPI002492B3DC|nr:helix-turn-helix transcriptional regulator [Litoreibacter halocynthiae]
MSLKNVRPSLLFIYVALIFQSVSALFFLGELWGEVLGLRSRPLPWNIQEIIQISASVGLITGVIVTSVFLRRSQQRISALDQQIANVSGNYRAYLESQFINWGLSDSEREIAIFAMKGFSNSEIADLRGTSASTVKSQMTAIYRKSNFMNRQQIISFLVEELLAGVTVEEKKTNAAELPPISWTVSGVN